jgi:hypothetical protein
MSLTRRLGRAVVTAILATAGIALTSTLLTGPPVDPDAIAQYHAPTIPERMIAAHGCWTSGDHGLPGHVIVTRDAHTGPEHLGGRRAVGHALDQIFSGIDRGWRVYAFCP